MDRARQNIREALNTAQCPAVMSSFGKDSLLLLTLVREQRTDIPVLWFKAATNSEQQRFARQIIREWNLVVYSYYPADVYLLTDNDNASLIQEYSFGDSRLPVVSDITVGETCSITAIPQRTPQLFLPFDLILTGYKDSDEHWLKGGAELFPPDYKLGRAKICAPIRHLTDAQVREAIYNLGVPYQEIDDSLTLCTRCMSETNTETVFCPVRGTLIPVEQWEKEQSLRAFRSRFKLDN